MNMAAIRPDTPAHVPGDLVIDFDIATDPGILSDPQARLTELFVDDPRDILYSPHHGGHWIVTSHELAQEILRTPDIFSSFPIGVPPNYEQRPRLIPLETDPPDHLRYRRLLAPVFKPATIRKLEEEVRARAESLLDTWLPQGSGDFLWDFAKPLPTGVFLKQMGLSESMMPDFWEWEHGFYRGETPEQRMHCAISISEHLSQAVEDHEKYPRDDIVSMLLDVEVDGERLLREEVDAICYLLFLAGVDTVATMLTYIFRYLAVNPEVYERIMNEPERINDSVDELLRMHAFINLNRVCTGDTDFHGIRFRQGDNVVIPTFAVDRDERSFPDPHQFDNTRSASERNLHHAFGAGGHKCAGIHLARLEVRVALEAFGRRVETFRIPDGITLAAHGGTVMGYEHLPLEWTLRR
jgi:cytochrome P450